MRFRLIAAFLGLALAAHAGPGFDAALALFNAKRYPEARVAFEQILAVDPNNAAACHYLGRTLAAKNSTTAHEEAVTWLARAVELEPDNAIYLGVYGGTTLQLAGRTNSFSAAKKGRDALEKALSIDPGYLDAREGLHQFYRRAPWPMGSRAKAAAQLEEIRRRDPDRAALLSVVDKLDRKDYAAAFRLCEVILAKNPDQYLALYQYGRAASLSRQNLERGLARLKRCLGLDPPTPGSPTHSNVWRHMGSILEILERPADARAAYESALQLDPSNQPAAIALAKLE